MRKTVQMPRFGTLILAVLLLVPLSNAAARPVLGSEKSQARKIMIPPPPPNIPLLGVDHRNLREFSGLNAPIEYMGRTDLEKLKVKLEDSWSKLSKKSIERSQAISECRSRVEQFESLYIEGVVSKKDVKAVKKELLDAEASDSDVDEQLAEVKKDLGLVDKRLKALKPQSKPVKLDQPAQTTPVKAAISTTASPPAKAAAKLDGKR